MEYQAALAEEWAFLSFGAVTTKTLAGQHTMKVKAFLGDLGPDAVSVELYANGRNGEGPSARR